MNRLLVLILILLGIESSTGTAAVQYSITRANLIYYRLVRYFLTVIGIILLGFLLNIIGIKGVNLLFSIIFTIAAIIFAMRPINLAVIAGAGAVIETLKENASLTVGAEKFLKYYHSAFLYLLLYGSIILYFLGTLSFRENPWAFVGITASVILLLLISAAWNLGPKMSKKIIFLYACAMLVLYTVSLVPRATWIKITGYDVKTLVSLSETETTLSEVEQTERKVIEKGAVKKLKEIQKKIERGVVLSQEEKTFLAEQKNKRDSDALLNKIIGVEAGVKKEKQQCQIQEKIVPQISYGWKVDSCGNLVADIKPGEEITKVFRMSEGYSTPFLVLPPEGYRLRFDHLQTIIVEEKGCRKKVVHPDDYYNMGVTQGQRRELKFTALKGGAEIITTLRREN